MKIVGQPEKQLRDFAQGTCVSLNGCAPWITTEQRAGDGHIACIALVDGTMTWFKPTEPAYEVDAHVVMKGPKQ